jgi:pilus assembly protein Flp/PilA
MQGNSVDYGQDAAVRRADMSKLFARFIKDESGVTAIEYGLIASLIALVIIPVVHTVGSHLDKTFQSIANSL